MQKNENNLLTQEWLVIVFLIILLIILTLSSHSFDGQSVPEVEKNSHNLVKSDMEVFIEGEVEAPGKYLVKRGSKIEDLVALAVPKTTADLKGVKLKNLLKKGQCIKVSCIKMIKIYLKFYDGKLEELTVPKSSKFTDLPIIYSFKEEVDVSKFMKKRLLKDGETIVVNIKKNFKISSKQGFSPESKNN